MSTEWTLGEEEAISVVCKKFTSTLLNKANLEKKTFETQGLILFYNILKLKWSTGRFLGKLLPLLIH